MITTYKVRKLTKSEIEAVTYTGLITRVAEKTSKSLSTVSRTLRGEFKRPNPEIVRALEVELDRIEQEQGSAA